MEQFFSNKYGALELTLLWNGNAVFFKHSLVMYEEDKTHKVVDTIIPISYNPGYIQWLCDNRANLMDLFIEGIWYQNEPYQLKQSHAYKEMQSYFGDNYAVFHNMCNTAKLNEMVGC